MGGPEQVKEEVRDARAGAWLDQLWQDVRYAARLLRKNPSFTAVAVLTLALGIGANTAVFSIVNTTVLHPLPYKDADQLVDVHATTPLYPKFRLGLSWIAFAQVRDQVSAFEQVIATTRRKATLTGEGDPAQLQTATVSDGFFEFFGQTPQVGRFLVPQDQEDGKNQVVVLSDTLWRTRYGSDRGVIGRTLVLNKKPFVVVGVTKKGFDFPEDSELWCPLQLTKGDRENPTWLMFNTIGKLKPHTTLGQAQVQLDAIGDRLTHDYQDLKDGFKLPALSLVENSVRGYKSAYLMLLAAATLVLLIASANMASLLLARGWARQRELAVRAALGASRGRLLRQVLTESCLLALLGAVAGFVLAAGGIYLFRIVTPFDTPRLSAISVNLGMLWFALGSALFAGLVCGLAPARRASRLDPNSTMQEGATGSRGSTGSVRQLRLGNLLVVTEVSLAFLLLIGSVLTAKDLVRLLRVDTGFRTDHLLTMDLSLESPQTRDSAIRQEQDLSQILERIRHLPGVEDVAAADVGVLNNMMSLNSGLRFEGELPQDKRSTGMMHSRAVTPGYFKMLAIPVLRGREFAEQDIRGGERVAIVNESLAKGRWGTNDVIGKRMSISTDDKGNPIWIVIVGVVADTRDVSLESQPAMAYYTSLLQSGVGSHHFMVRTAGDPEALSGAVTHAIWSVLPEQPITHIYPLSQVISRSVGQPRMRVALLGLFAGIGLALALLGVYGVVSYTVIRRTREIGIRVALGAQRTNVLRMVLWQGLALGAIGVVIGTLGGMALAKVIATQLFELKATDPATYIGAALLMIGVACIACYIPARRAMKVDPIVALRYE
jgi:putative ABC transport system permease protein